MDKKDLSFAAVCWLAPALLTGCNGQWQPVVGSPFPLPNSHMKGDIGYVSANPHVPNTIEASYVSALEEAMQETPSSSAPQPHLPPQESAGLFGIPAGGSGITLLDTATRQRLNDALSTTPTGQSVKWQAGELTYTLAPNSPVYIPQHSGGNCRDAVLSIYGNGFTNIRQRNLFCQAGPSSDWIVVLEE